MNPTGLHAPDGLIASAARHSRRSIVLSSFYRGELPELRRRSIGPDLVFGRLWQETGCRDVLRSLLADRDFGFDVERVVYLTVLHRLMVSGSDRHAAGWHQRLRLPGAEALTLKQAYKAMARLGEEVEPGRYATDAIEEALYRHRQPLFGELSVAFFDTTSLYFEGKGGATLGQRGFSKDYRPQLHQVVLGIVLDGQDRPVASFLWPGNTADVTTLLPVVVPVVKVRPTRRGEPPLPETGQLWDIVTAPRPLPEQTARAGSTTTWPQIRKRLPSLPRLHAEERPEAAVFQGQFQSGRRFAFLVEGVKTVEGGADDDFVDVVEIVGGE